MDTKISVKKLILKRSRKISFKLIGHQDINVDLQLKKETGFRTKSRFECNFCYFMLCYVLLCYVILCITFSAFESNPADGMFYTNI